MLNRAKPLQCTLLFTPIQWRHKVQHWFCGACKTVEECSQYVTMIYHKHDTSLVILSPLSQQTAQELRTKITTIKKARNRDKAQTLRTALAETAVMDTAMIQNNTTLTNQYLDQTCKRGQGKETCRYLALGMYGWECLKLTQFKGTLDERVSNNTIHAQGDNCEGVSNDIEAR